LPGAHELRIDGPRVRCEVEPDALDPVFRRLAACGIRSIAVHPPTLEQLFMRHYHGDAEARR
jgi:ABC-2 type transport system ATP-binding protein